MDFAFAASMFVLLLSCSHIWLSVLQRVVFCRLCLLARCHWSLRLFCVLCRALPFVHAGLLPLLSVTPGLCLCCVVPCLLCLLACIATAQTCGARDAKEWFYLPRACVCFVRWCFIRSALCMPVRPPARIRVRVFSLCPSDAIVGLLASAHVCLCVSDSAASAALACR